MIEETCEAIEKRINLRVKLNQSTIQAQYSEVDRGTTRAGKRDRSRWIDVE
jgi:hypothetical protein